LLVGRDHRYTLMEDKMAKKKLTDEQVEELRKNDRMINNVALGVEAFKVLRQTNYLLPVKPPAKDVDDKS
jgi:hypothetical protein